MKQMNSYEELPLTLCLTLCAEDVASVLGISRTNAYALLHREDFPTLHIGKRLLVPRDEFIQWIRENTNS